MKKIWIPTVCLIALPFIISIYLYPLMPDLVVSHWGTHGEADGHMSKFWGLFLFPTIILAVYALLLSIPKLDPLLQQNFHKFKKHFDIFLFIFISFLFYVYTIIVAWNMGFRFNMMIWLAPGFAILFYYVGVLIEHTERNYVIGIRTPWTLHSDSIWKKTHILGGSLFKITGAFALMGMFFDYYAFMFTFFPAVCAAIYSTIYSYIQYRKETQG